MSVFVLLPAPIGAGTLPVAGCRLPVAGEIRLLGLSLRERSFLTAAHAGFSYLAAPAALLPTGAIKGAELIELRQGAQFPNLECHRAVFAAQNIVFSRPGLTHLLATPLAPGHALIDDGGIAIVELQAAGDFSHVVANLLSGSTIRKALTDYAAESIDKNPATCRSVGEDYIALITADDLSRAEEQLLKSLVKDTEGFMSRHVERKISLAITRRIVNRGVSPIQMTLVSLAIGIAAAPFFLSSRPAWQFVGTLLFLLHSILDGCDGELARLTFRESRIGGLLDFWGDNVVHAAIFAAIGLGWAKASGSMAPHGLGLAAILGTFAAAGTVYFSTMRRQNGKEESGPLFRHVVEIPNSRTTRVMDLLARRDFIYLIVILAAFGEVRWFLLLASAGAPVFALLLLVLSRRERGNRGRALDSQAAPDGIPL